MSQVSEFFFQIASECYFHTTAKTSNEKNLPLIDFSPISNAFCNYSTAAWENFKIRFISSTKFIADVQQNLATDDSEKTAFINALQSPHFHILRPMLTDFFRCLPISTKDKYLTRLAENSAETGQTELMSRCLHLLSHDNMVDLIKHNHDSAFDMLETARNYIEIFDIQQEFNPKDLKGFQLTSELGQLLPKAAALLTRFMNLIISCLEMFTAIRAPKSAWDAAFELQIYYQFIAVPATIFAFIQSYVSNPILNKSALAAALIGIAGFTCSYRKWLEPRPQELPYAKNLTKSHKENPSRHVLIGREKEMEIVLNQLAINVRSSSREHCLIQGLSGVGKTSFIYGLSSAIAKGDVAPELKGVDVHYIHSSDIRNRKATYVNKTAYDEILEVMGRHKNKIVIVIDDLHELMKKEELRGPLLKLLQSTDPSENLPLFVGVTPVNFKKDETTASFFIKEGHARRFKKIKFKELDKNATIQIMKTVKMRENDLFSITDAQYEKIFTNAQKDKEKLEPGNSINHLENILKRTSKTVEKRLTTVKSDLATTKRMIYQAKDEDKADLLVTKRAAENRIQQEVKLQASHEETVKTYLAKKERCAEVDASLRTLAVDVLNSPELSHLQMQFMFDYFYLKPALKQNLNHFASNQNLRLSLPDKIIEDHFTKEPHEKDSRTTLSSTTSTLS